MPGLARLGAKAAADRTGSVRVCTYMLRCFHYRSWLADGRTASCRGPSLWTGRRGGRRERRLPLRAPGTSPPRRALWRGRHPPAPRSPLAAPHHGEAAGRNRGQGMPRRHGGDLGHGGRDSWYACTRGCTMMTGGAEGAAADPRFLFGGGPPRFLPGCYVTGCGSGVDGCCPLLRRLLRRGGDAVVVSWPKNGVVGRVVTRLGGRTAPTCWGAGLSPTTVCAE